MSWEMVKSGDRVTLRPLDNKKPTIGGFVNEVDSVSRAFVTMEGCGRTQFQAGEYGLRIHPFVDVGTLFPWLDPRAHAACSHYDTDRARRECDVPRLPHRRAAAYARRELGMGEDEPNAATGPDIVDAYLLVTRAYDKGFWEGAISWDGEM